MERGMETGMETGKEGCEREGGIQTRERSE